MPFLFIALSVFVVCQLLDLLIEAPTWAFTLAKIPMAALGLWVAGENPGWCLGVAGLVVMTDVTYALLLALGDWARVGVLRNTRR